MSSRRPPPHDPADAAHAPSATTGISLDSTGEFPLAPGDYFFHLLHLATRRRDLHFEQALHTCGLNLARWRILAVIRRIGDCTMTALALHSTIDRTTLTRSVDQLVKQGLVERMIRPRDRRKVSLSLSPAGETLCDRGAALLLESNARLLDGLADAELRSANRLLQTMVRRTAADAREAAELIGLGRPGRRAPG